MDEQSAIDETADLEAAGGQRLSPQRIRALAFAAGGAVLLLFAAFGGGSEKSLPAPARISADSFPRGPAGLADSSAAADQAIALTTEITREQADEAAKKRELADSRSRLGSNIETTEPGKSAAVNETGAASGAKKSADGKAKAKDRPETPFSRFGPKITLPLAAHSGGDGALWVAHHRGITVFRRNGTIKAALDRRTYDVEFNEDLPAATALISSPQSDEVWAGFSDGQVMRYQRYEWQRKIEADTAVRGRVRALAMFNKDLYIGGKGLFKWNADTQSMVANPNFRDVIIGAFARTEKDLFLGGQNGLFKFNNDADQSWTNIWKGTRRDVMIRTIQIDSDGSFLLGTFNGLTRVSPHGVVVERFLENTPVSDILVEKDGKLWVATNKHGLKYYDGEQWYTAGKDQGLSKRIIWLRMPDEKHLSAGMAGDGVMRAPLEELRSWITKFPDVKDSGSKPRIFPDLCEAAGTLLKGVNLSGNLAIEEIDGIRHVFVDGKKHCPAGLGYRRKDGAVALLSGSALTIYFDGARTEMTLPEEIPVGASANILYDSQNRLWLAMPDAGVFHFVDEKNWKHYNDVDQLVDNPVKSILEDDRGNIWIGTIPPYDSKAQAYHKSSLHLFNDKGWFHYDPRNGLAQISTHALALKRDGTLVVGTHGGFSLITPKAEITSYGPRQELDPYFIYSATVDRKGDIWFTHQYFGRGATKFDGHSYYRFDSENGLFSDRLLKVAQDRSGRTWFIASNGQVGVYPLSLLKQSLIKKEIPAKTVRTINMYP